MGVNEIIQIGSRIKGFRKAMGYTQKEFAALCGIPYSTYSNYENNNREPSKAQLEKIANALNVTEAQLLGVEHARAEVLKKAIEKRIEKANEKTPFYSSDQIDLLSGRNEIKYYDKLFTEMVLEMLAKREGFDVTSLPQIDDTPESRLEARKQIIRILKEDNMIHGLYFDESEYTQEELGKIQSYAEFIKSQR